jgi:hypothetical protein
VGSLVVGHREELRKQEDGGMEPTVSVGTNRHECRKPRRLKAQAARAQPAAAASRRSITNTVIVEKMSAHRKVPCSIAKPPSMAVPPPWKAARRPGPNVGPDALPAPANRAALFIEKVTQASITGTMPMRTAGQWRWSVDSNACTVMMNPIQMMIARPASAGTAQAIADMAPVRQTIVTKMPLAVE